jgi:NIPSNAP
VLYEYRRYEAALGRMPDLQRRFREVTLKLWEKHGVVQVGFWVAQVGDSNQLHYLLRWADAAERERNWGAFLADPEWRSAKAASEANGAIVAGVHNEFWSPTDFSALK